MLRQDLVDERLVAYAPSPRFLAKLVEHAGVDTNRDELARRRAERPTRCIVRSCAGDESGMSLKSIVRAVRRAFAPARTPGADEADFLDIVRSPKGVRDHEHAPVSRSAQPQGAELGPGVLEIRAIQGSGIEKDGHGEFEGDAVLRRIDRGFPRVPTRTRIQYIRNAAY